MTQALINNLDNLNYIEEEYKEIDITYPLEIKNYQNDNNKLEYIYKLKITIAIIGIKNNKLSKMPNIKNMHKAIEITIMPKKPVSKEYLYTIKFNLSFFILSPSY